jgi:hypothetical protein
MPLTQDSGACFTGSGGFSRRGSHHFLVRRPTLVSIKVRVSRASFICHSERLTLQQHNVDASPCIHAPAGLLPVILVAV